MKEGDRRYLSSVRHDNMQRLRNLGLPTDLFSEGFWEREAVARQRELMLLAMFEAAWKAGQWDGLLLPFEQIIERWKADIAHPLHFASIGPNPRWVIAMSRAGNEWSRLSSGAYRKTWREYRRRQITARRKAQGKPPPKFRM